MMSTHLDRPVREAPSATSDMFALIYEEMKKVMNTSNAFLYNLAKASAKRLASELRLDGEDPLRFATNYLVKSGLAREVEVDEERMVVRGKGLLFGSRIRSSEPADAVVAGILAGLLESATGRRVDVKEVACEAKGDPHCEFKIFVR